jgi:predicted CoA-substrate-specific enzyme activase
MIDLGIDVGSISVKVAVVGDRDDRELLGKIAAESGNFFSLDGVDSLPLLNGKSILVSNYKRIKGMPVQSTYELLKELYNYIPEGRIRAMSVTGTGGRLIGQLLDVPFENDFRAVAQGVGILHPDVKTVFEMGGENSKFISIEVEEDEGIVGILDYEKNGECAAGTGSFMDQQASRLKYEIEDVGDVVMGAGKAANIAGRCSVFAKSDMIHAMQKGFQAPEVLKGLCDAVVRNFKGTIVKNRRFSPKVVFIGGVAANKGVVQAMQSLFELSDEEFSVPGYYAWMSAIGTALLADNARERKKPEDIHTLATYSDAEGGNFPTTPPLSMDKVVLLRDKIKPYSFDDKPDVIDAYLGLDVGSVSTNLVAIDDNGDVIMEIYVPTEGDPIGVVTRNLKIIGDEIGSRIRVKGVGTTGSGRELTGVLTGADTISDEITAHKTGATHVADKLTGKRPDTIFEIGGQDSKFISIQDDVVVDFAMNEACAAGTGSFLEEQAEKLGINIIVEFAELALSSKHPIRLGERCTVFMEKDLNPYLQKGAKIEDLVAGLSLSIVTNYLNRVVRGRHIGDCIFFQGGTAYNDATAAAFATVLDKEIIVPPHNGVVGAIGAALLAREKMLALGEKETTFNGYNLDEVDYRIRSFTCQGCSNHCDIQEVNVKGERTYWGDKCSERYRKRSKTDKKPVIPDLISFRQELLFGEYDEQQSESPRPKIGIPRAMYTYDMFPFWNTFLSELGFEVVLSDKSNKKVINYGIDAVVAEPCFPLKLAHGHVRDLLDRDVDYIFIPNMLNVETEFMDVNSHVCPWGQTMTFVIGHTPMMEGKGDMLLQPTVHFRDGKDAVTGELQSFVKPFGIRKKHVAEAVDMAYRAQMGFQQRLLEEGRKALKILEEEDELGIVLVGRSYNMYDSGVDLAIPSKLRDYYGVNVIPMDFLSLKGIDVSNMIPNMYWDYGRKILQAARVVSQHPNLHIIYITNFKCGPDSYIKQYVRGVSGGKPFLSLQFDGHSNDAGFMTRCEAYLDSKGFLRWWKREQMAVAV